MALVAKTNADGIGYIGAGSTLDGTVFENGTKYIADTAASILASKTYAAGLATTAETNAKNASVLRTRQIPLQQDLNTFHGSANEGTWSMSSESRAAGVLNKPPGVTNGFVTVDGGSLGWQTFWSYTSGVPGEIWARNRLSISGDSWSEWKRIFPPEAPPTPNEKYSAGYAAQGQATRRGFALRRLGGTIGTAGRAALALRFDDNPAGFRDKVLPVLQSLDLPGYIASATRYYDETGVAYTDAQTWAINDGVSIANHTKTHGDSTTDDAIYDNTVGAADLLETNMPKILVDVWTMPSMSGTKMNGYDDGRYVANFMDTTAGRVIASRHAVVNGYSGGRLQPLVGEPTFGQTHLTFETMTFADFKKYVDEAIEYGAGLTLMLHPSRIDAAGYLTAATFQQCMEYVAQVRAEDKALVLSPLGIGFADAGHSKRHNLLPASAFPDGIKSAMSTVAVPLSPNLSMRGAVCEVRAKVKATTAGAVVRTGVTNTASGLSATKDHTLADTNWREVRKLFTIPTSMPFSDSLTVSVGTVSGGDVEFRDVQINAI